MAGSIIRDLLFRILSTFFNKNSLCLVYNKKIKSCTVHNVLVSSLETVLLIRRPPASDYLPCFVWVSTPLIFGLGEWEANAAASMVK